MQKSQNKTEIPFDKNNSIYGCLWYGVIFPTPTVWISSSNFLTIIMPILLRVIIRAFHTLQSIHEFVHCAAHIYRLFVIPFNIYPSLHYTLPLSQGGTHCRWIGHRWFVGVRWRVSVHWLCVHSVTWCWSAETAKLSWDPDPNPSTSHVKCLRLAGWSDQVPYCGLIVLVRSTPRWYFHDVIMYDDFMTQKRFPHH